MDSTVLAAPGRTPGFPAWELPALGPSSDEHAFQGAAFEGPTLHHVQRAAAELWLRLDESAGFVLSELGVYALELFIGALGAPSLLGTAGDALLLQFVLTGALLAILLGICYQLPLPLPARLLLAGFVIGPHVLGIVPELGVAHGLIELGALLVAFMFGMSLGRERLARYRPYLTAGITYAGLTIGITALVLVSRGMGGPDAVFTGFLVAVGFTPITAHFLTRRGDQIRECDGLSLGLAAKGLLAVEGGVALIGLTLLPPLAAAPNPIEAVSGMFVKALLAGALAFIVFIFARRAVPERVERTRTAQGGERAWTTLLALSGGLVAVSAALGLPLALGVFLAGLLLSRIRSWRVTGRAHLLRWVVMASFLVPLGAVLDPQALLPYLPAALLFIAAMFAASLILSRFAGAFVGGSANEFAWPSGTALVLSGGVGELSFLLFYEGRRVGLSPGGGGEVGEAVFLAAGVASVLLLPGLVKAARCAERTLRRQRASHGHSRRRAPQSERPARRTQLAFQVEDTGCVLDALRKRLGHPGRVRAARLSTPVCSHGRGGPRLWTVSITDDMPAARMPLYELARRSGPDFHVVALWHQGAYMSHPPTEHRLQPGDIALVSGASHCQRTPYFRSPPRD